MLEVGTIVAGKLRIDRLIGRGGMGVVAVATHLHLDQQFAIKVVHDELASDGEAVARLLREARASSRLRSEHVCRVADVGQLDSGVPYIVMELLEGEDLAQLIAQAPLDVPTAVDHVLQACVAIAEAHAVGIVHRDLKPANLFVTRRIDGSALVKVLDFGIAKAQAAGDFKLTRTQAVMGSPGYMSPEALRSATDVDLRSDIWALGVILYEAVSGRLPFHAKSITELAVKVTIDAPEPLDTDPRYAAIVMRCLQKRADDRYQNIAELAAELAPLGSETAHSSATMIMRLSGIQPSVRPQMSARVPVAQSTTMSNFAGQSAVTLQRSRGRALWVLGGLLVAAGAAAGAILVVKSRGSETGVVRDAALVAQVHAPDAGALADADPADAAENLGVRDKLRRLAAAHDYYAILQIADLDPGDPEAANIVADAKQHYIAQLAHTIDAEIHDGQCAKAREVATEAQQIVPDDTTLAAKAKACTARPTHVDAISTGAEAAAAQRAYTRGDNTGALAAAEKVLVKQPEDAAMLRIAAAASCNVGDAPKARAYASKLTGAEHDFAVYVCQQNGISLEARKPEDPYGDVDLDAVNDAMKRGDFSAALKEADAVLRKDRNNVTALTALGIAACELKRVPRAKNVWKRLPEAQRPAIEQACARKGITLD